MSKPSGPATETDDKIREEVRILELWRRRPRRDLELHINHLKKILKKRDDPTFIIKLNLPGNREGTFLQTHFDDVIWPVFMLNGKYAHPERRNGVLKSSHPWEATHYQKAAAGNWEPYYETIWDITVYNSSSWKFIRKVIALVLEVADQAMKNSS